MVLGSNPRWPNERCKMTTKEKWSKIWREHGRWCDNPSKEFWYPDWDEQKINLGRLIRKEFGIAMQGFWAKVDNMYDERTDVSYYVTWRMEQNIIRKVCESRYSGNSAKKA